MQTEANALFAPRQGRILVVDDAPANIQAVTAENVAKAAATYIQPRRFAVVIAGDRKAIEPSIRALNLGPVRIIDIDELLK